MSSFLNQIDQGKCEFYRKHPELILQTSNWVNFAVCSFCRGELDVESHGGLLVRDRGAIKEHRCPHCLNSGGSKPLGTKKAWRGTQRELLIAYPLPHTRYRKRFHTTSRVKHWFREDKITGFWEVEEIPHFKPLPTPVEPESHNPFHGKRCPECGAKGFRQIRAGTVKNTYDVICRRKHEYRIVDDVVVALPKASS